MALTPAAKLAAGRLYACRKAPYFSSALVALVPRQADGLGTFAVTKAGFLMWDPAVALRWSVPEIAAVLVHELGHLLREHHDRFARGNLDPTSANIAGDIEINDDLLAGGWQLPQGCVTPETYGCKKGLLMEEYYQTVRGQHGSDPPVPTAAGGWCGSAGGHEVPNEPDANDPQGRSTSDIQRIKRETAEAVKQAAQRGRGTVPAGWERWADAAMRPPVVPWQTLLGRAVRHAVTWRAGGEDQTYTRLNRRQGGLGFGSGRPLLAGRQAPQPLVAAFLDTSGSMGQDEGETVLSEINAVVTQIGCEVLFGAIDTQMHSLAKIEKWQDIIPLIKGGGGTDFRPAFDEIAKMKPRPNVVIFGTDGQGPAPKTPPPGVQVIWLLVGPYQQHPYFDTDGEEAQNDDEQPHGKEWGTMISVPCGKQP